MILDKKLFGGWFKPWRAESESFVQRISRRDGSVPLNNPKNFPNTSWKPKTTKMSMEQHLVSLKRNDPNPHWTFLVVGWNKFSRCVGFKTLHAQVSLTHLKVEPGTSCCLPIAANDRPLAASCKGEAQGRTWARVLCTRNSLAALRQFLHMGNWKGYTSNGRVQGCYRNQSVSDICMRKNETHHSWTTIETFHARVRQVRHQEAGDRQSFWDRTAGMSCSPHLACIAWSLGHCVRDFFEKATWCGPNSFLQFWCDSAVVGCLSWSSTNTYRSQTTIYYKTFKVWMP